MPPKKRSGGDLVIVESPAKAKTIERYLGAGYTVIASLGHVRDLPQAQPGRRRGARLRAALRAAQGEAPRARQAGRPARKADQVWLATDLDREGEAIAWHIAEYAKCPTERLRRVTFSEITKGAIEEAFANPREINLDLVNAQQARRVIDRLVGYKLSPLVGSKIRRGLSAGRVQSRRGAAGRRARARDRAPSCRRSTGRSTPSCAAQARTASVRGRADQASTARRLESAPRPRPTRARGRAARGRATGSTRSRSSEQQAQPRRRRSPPARCSRRPRASWLRRAAHDERGAAALRGRRPRRRGPGRPDHLHAHRLAARRPTARVAEARDVHRPALRRRLRPGAADAYRTKQPGAQEAHEAIRPTELARTPESRARPPASPTQFRLYELIWKRFVASQMAPARFDAGRRRCRGRPLHRCTPAAGKRRRSTASWRVYVEGRDDEEDETPRRLPDLRRGRAARPARPAQRAALHPAAAALHRGHADQGARGARHRPAVDLRADDRDDPRARLRDREDRRLLPRGVGFRVTDLLVEHFPEIVDLDFTARMEEQLDEVAAASTSGCRWSATSGSPFSARGRPRARRTSPSRSR